MEIGLITEDGSKIPVANLSGDDEIPLTFTFTLETGDDPTTFNCGYYDEEK